MVRVSRGALPQPAWLGGDNNCCIERPPYAIGLMKYNSCCMLRADTDGALHTPRRGDTGSHDAEEERAS
jgi:hypothetical protein